MNIAKPKTLISCAATVTARLVCAFVFADTKTGFLMTRLSCTHLKKMICNNINFQNLRQIFLCCPSFASVIDKKIVFCGHSK